MKRKLLSITLAVCMIISILPITGLAAEGTYSDTSGHWANAAIERWSDYGVLSGYNGQFRPSDPITRAELASVLDKVMRYQEKSDITDFSDIDASAWYAPSILKLNAAGVMLGSDGKMRPNDSITREEAAVMIGRAFAVPENSGNENPFPDADAISGWASFLVDGMKAAGYISGYPDGSFGPKNTITRAEVVMILDNMVEVYLTGGGERDCELIGEINGNVVINTADTHVKNLYTNGDLYIAPGVGSGEVTLENVTVSGTTYIWGGGPNSIIANDCDFNVVRLDALTSPALKFSPDTKAVQIYLDNTATVTHGGVTVKYDAATDTVTFGGTIDKVTLNADGTATISIGGIIYDVIPPEGTVSKFELAKDAVVKDMVINAPVDVGGTGKIEKMEVHTDGVVIDKDVNVKPEDITVDKDVTIDIGGKEYTGDGKTLPPNNPPSDNGGSYVPPTSTYIITIIDDGNGTASASTASATAGTQITITATPNTQFFQFKQWVVVSGGVTLSNTTDNPATFNMPGESVEIKAHFEPTQAAIDAANAEAAKITAAGIAAGANNTNNLVFDITPSSALDAGATLTLVDIKTGAASPGVITALDAVLTNTTLSLKTQKTVDATDLTYVGLTFTATLNGVTSDPVTLDISTMFGSTTTAGKLRTDKKQVTDILPWNLFVESIPAYGTEPYNTRRLSEGVTISSTSNDGSQTTIGTGTIFAESDKDPKVTYDVTSAGNLVFTNVPLVCDGTQYIISSITVYIQLC